MLVLGDRLDNSIAIQQILKSIGYDVGSTVPARILSLVSEFAGNSYNFIDPSYSYIIRDIQSV